jgi:ubiquinone/menaquinone biosynthesis C-methylase UbiE
MSTLPAAAVNHWPEAKCARAFWDQQALPPYRNLLRDTAAWLEPRPGQRWLDLGCGGGQLTRTLWEKSGGRLAEVVALDCADANARSIGRLRGQLQPLPTPEQIRFVHADFSAGLGAFADGHFDGAVSGLSIQYAESWSAEQGRWTTDAYDRLLTEVCRVLRPGGTFVFSVNVPNPAWLKIALFGVPALFRTGRPLRYMKRSLRMLRYGSWLKREARNGRFHYLPVEANVAKLTAAGFTAIEHRRSFAGQAYVLRCRKPA